MELLGLFRAKGNFKDRGKQLKLHTDPAHPSSPATLMPSDFKAHMKVYLQKITLLSNLEGAHAAMMGSPTKV